MRNPDKGVNSYRWVVLAVFMLVMGVQQLLWINFASITDDASRFYGVSNMGIGMLSMVFMIVYIVLSIPASWLIDRLGFRKAVTIGALLTGVFGLLRGISAGSYQMVLISQIGIAAGQPLVINAVAKVAAIWFPLRERATATGLSWLAGYLGLIAGLVMTPFLSETRSIPFMLTFYGLVSAAAAAVFILLSRDNNRGSGYDAGQAEKILMFDGFRQLFAKKDFILFNIVFFIGMGVFNGLSTWIEEVVRPRGFDSAQAGTIGGCMVVCGVLGSGIIPILSDRFRNRTRFILLAVGGCIPGLAGIAYAQSYWLLLVSACILGFFMLSTAPVGFQYCAEIGHPVPEGTSTGVLMLMGQLSGIIFIFGMDALKSPATGSMTIPILGLIILMLAGTVISARLKESALLRTNNDSPSGEDALEQT